MIITKKIPKRREDKVLLDNEGTRTSTSLVGVWITAAGADGKDITVGLTPEEAWEVHWRLAEWTKMYKGTYAYEQYKRKREADQQDQASPSTRREQPERGRSRSGGGAGTRTDRKVSDPR